MILTARIEEQDTGGYPRLGRHVEHDDRSWDYQLTAALSSRRKIYGHVWPTGEVLDQGQLGSCVGNATMGQIGCGPNQAPLSAEQRSTYGEPQAVKFYSLATHLDSAPGVYPPNDTGSSGLAGAKAAKKLGYISGYVHAFSFTAMQKYLQLGPVMVGTNWYQGMFTPDSTGTVSISGSVAGGHEYLCYGLDVGLKRMLFQNSWGTSWGNGGHFFMSFATVERLLGERGDVTMFLPLATPAPTPTPVSTVSPEDLAIADAVRTWAKVKGITL